MFTNGSTLVKDPTFVMYAEKDFVKVVSDFVESKIPCLKAVFLISSILPKNERKQFNLRYYSRYVGWKNQGFQKVLLKLTDL